MPAPNLLLSTLNQNLKGETMKEFCRNLSNLLNVKTLVTMVVMAVFAMLTLRGAISPDNAMIVISMVVSFYFGTQHEKKLTIDS